MLNERSEADDDDVSENFNVYEGGTCSPGGTCYRYLALGFMCFLGFGSYFCFDNPGALQDVIVKDMSLKTSEFSYLYSSYSWPNVILCFIGGFLIDRVFGIRFGTPLYAFIVLVGQIFFAVGSFLDSFVMMIIGRVIFGIGGESLAVAQNNYAVLWFKGHELNMIFGLQLSFARLGSAVNFIVMGPLYDFVHKYFKGREGLGVTLLAASATCLLSFICAICLAYMDKKTKPDRNTKETKENKEVVKLTDIKDFSTGFWLVCVICVAYYIAIFPLIALGKVFFMRKFDFSAVQANQVNSLLYGISAVASPLLGLVVDKTGWNLLWVFVSICVTIVAHGFLAFTFWNPLIAMTILGLGYSMCASALWPMISMVIPEYQLGTAYGVAQAFQNLGLAVATLLAGMIVDYGGYLMLEMFFLIWLFVALIACLCMWFYDIVTTGVLNMTSAQRAEYEQKQKESLLLPNAFIEDPSTSEDASRDITDSQIRNRYLARVGTNSAPPDNVDPSASQVFPTLR